MFDGSYGNLFDCWIEWFQNSSLHHPLEIVVYDREAEAHVVAWMDRHPDLPVRLHPMTFFDHPSRGQPVTVPASFPLEPRNLRANTDARWPSNIYKLNYWPLVRERLREGKDVLHLDLDAIATGDAWAPLKALDFEADVDLACPGGSPPHNAQYMFLRSTPVVLDLVDYMIKEWKQYKGLVRKMSVEQDQLKEYLFRHGFTELEKTRGVDVEPGHARVFECRTHTGAVLRSAQLLTGVKQNAKTPDECREEGISIAHGRHFVRAFCPGHNLTRALKH